MWPLDEKKQEIVQAATFSFYIHFPGISLSSDWIPRKMNEKRMCEGVHRGLTLSQNASRFHGHLPRYLPVHNYECNEKKNVSTFTFHAS